MAKKPSYPRSLPSEHEAARIKSEMDVRLAAEEAKRQEGRTRAAFDWLLRDERGRRVWAYLFHLCGAQKTSLAYFAAGDVAPMKTECKEAQRLVYLKLREMVTPEILVAAEYEAEHGIVLTTSDQIKKGDKKDA